MTTRITPTPEQTFTPCSRLDPSVLTTMALLRHVLSVACPYSSAPPLLKGLALPVGCPEPLPGEVADVWLARVIAWGSEPAVEILPSLPAVRAAQAHDAETPEDFTLGYLRDLLKDCPPLDNSSVVVIGALQGGVVRVKPSPRRDRLGFDLALMVDSEGDGMTTKKFREQIEDIWEEDGLGSNLVRRDSRVVAVGSGATGPTIEPVQWFEVREGLVAFKVGPHP